MTRALNRRAALAGLAVGALALPAGPAVAQDDAAWRTLYEAWRTSLVAMLEAGTRLDNAKTAVRAQYQKPSLPMSHAAYSSRRGDEGFRWRWCDGEELLRQRIKLRPISSCRAAIERHFDERLRLHEHLSDGYIDDGNRRRAVTLAAFDGWVADCLAVDALYGIPELQHADQVTTDAHREIHQRIMDTQANSVAGVAVKLSGLTMRSHGTMKKPIRARA